MKIFTVSCPHCQKETNLSVKNKEVLKEMNADCPCGWKDIANNGIIQEKEFDNWFS